jgi:uncharacterized protein
MQACRGNHTMGLENRILRIQCYATISKYQMGIRLAVGLFLSILSITSSTAQCVSLNDLSVYQQNFDTLAASGTSSILPPGWFLAESGTNANTTYTADNGSSNAGDAYSYGAAGNTDRALGGLQSGALIPAIGACFVNETGGSILVRIGYTGEQWRLGATGRPDRLDFQYSLDATSLTTGSWTDLNALDFNAPISNGTVGALDGNTNHRVIAPVMVAAVPNGATLWIRWSDFNANGADDGLAVDDFSLVPEAGIVITFDPPRLVPVSAASAVNQPVTTNGSECAFAAENLPSWLMLADVTGSGFRVSGTAPATGTYAFSVSAACKEGSGSVQYSVLVFAAISCGGAKTAIHTIQRGGLTSGMTGAAVEVEGIVTGTYQSTTNGQSGFYMQEPDSEWDANPATSEGIFIFDNGFGVPVGTGDRVRVKGTVNEFASAGSSLTEIGGVNAVQVCGTGNDFARTIVTLPVANLSDWEKYEGMAVRFEQPLVVTGNFDLAQFSQVDLAPSVLIQPTQVVLPGKENAAQQELNERSRIQMDDGSESQNRFPIPFSFSQTIRTGDTAGYLDANCRPAPLEGVIDHRHGAYRIIPIDPSKVTFAATNPRPEAVESVGGRFTAASANLNNFFFGPPFPTSRGADTQAEFDRQWQKTVAALCGMNADILAINELGNNMDADPNRGLNFLLGKLNTSPGCGPYTAIDTGRTGTDDIRSAILYKAERVKPAGAFALLDLPLPELNRPSIAQTFQPATGGNPERQYFTIVTNHYKARNPSNSCDADTGEGQDSCNTMRLNIARHVLCWLYGGCDAPYSYPGNPTADPTPDGNRKYLLVGDFNSYLKEDPIRALTDPTFSKAPTNRYPAGFPANPHANFVDLMDRIIGPEAYSYNFGSQNGYLDHALANPAMERLVTGVFEWHINSDEPTVFDYNVEFKSAAAQAAYYAPDPFRNSDHDPFIVGFNPLAGDLNDDGVVDHSDGALLKAQIGKAVTDDGVDRRMDYDGDGAVTWRDYRIWSKSR